jgi:hypothetical protein
MKSFLTYAAAFLIFTLCETGSASTLASYRWTEDALLHDGRTVQVDRQLEERTELRLQHPFFGLPISPRRERAGDIHYLRFRHPDTGVAITWQGKEYHQPVLLDVVDGIAYLVISAQPRKRFEQELGCPELPWVFLKSDSNSQGRWSPIPVERAPGVLRIANLAPGYESNLAHRTVDSVERLLREQEVGYNYQFQREIPRSYEEWKLDDRAKDQYRNARYGDDCRPPPKPAPDAALPPPVEVDLEVVETTTGVNKTADEYYRLIASKKGTATRDNCKALFTRADPANSMAGDRFVNDAGRTKIPPYQGRPTTQINGDRTTRYCDAKSIWFVAEEGERRKILITKYTAAGDLVYNARITTPRSADNKLHQQLVIDSTSAESDHFYFHWHESLPSPNLGPYAYRSTRFRFREPSSETAPK